MKILYKNKNRPHTICVANVLTSVNLASKTNSEYMKIIKYGHMCCHSNI